MLSKKTLLDLVKVVSHYETLVDSVIPVQVDIQDLLDSLESELIGSVSSTLDEQDDDFDDDDQDQSDDSLSGTEPNESNDEKEDSVTISPKELHKLRHVKAHPVDENGEIVDNVAHLLEFECVISDDKTLSCDLLVDGDDGAIQYEDIISITRNDGVIQVITSNDDDVTYHLVKVPKAWETVFPNNVSVAIGES